MINRIMQMVEQANLKSEPQNFKVGDTVDVHVRITEGDKERIQLFSGVVLSRKGSGAREMFTVRRIVAGEGVERMFPLNSPKIAKIEVKRGGKTRRAKIYFLRKRVGKATRLRDVEQKAEKGEVEVQAQPAEAAAV